MRTITDGLAEFGRDLIGTRDKEPRRHFAPTQARPLSRLIGRSPSLCEKTVMESVGARGC